MTELAISLFPYAMLILGIILLGNLSLGKVEGRQAVVWATPRPGEQTEANVREHFFVNRAGSEDPDSDFDFAEDTSYEPDVGSTSEEPVMPYAGADLLAAMTRMGYDATHHTTVNRDGTVTSQTVVNENLVWRYLESRGITGDDRLQDMTVILGSWLDYSRSWTEYAYRLPTRGYFIREAEDEEARAFRDWFRMGGESAEGYDAHGVSRNTDDNRGMHLSDPEIDFSLMNQQMGVSLEFPNPDADMNTTSKGAWDKNNGF